MVEVRNQALDAVEADLVGWYHQPPFDWQVARLAAYRGVTRLGALTLAAEVADWQEGRVVSVPVRVTLAFGDREHPGRRFGWRADHDAEVRRRIKRNADKLTHESNESIPDSVAK